MCAYRYKICPGSAIIKIFQAQSFSLRQLLFFIHFPSPNPIITQLGRENKSSAEICLTAGASPRHTGSNRPRHTRMSVCAVFVLQTRTAKITTKKLLQWRAKLADNPKLLRLRPRVPPTERSVGGTLIQISF